MIRKKIFGDGFIDEVDLFHEIKKVSHTKLTRDKLRDISNELGVDGATNLLYQQIYESNKEFIEKINAYPEKTSISQHSIKIYVMPGMFYKEYPEMGCDGEFIKKIVEKFNFACEIVELQSRGSAVVNKNILREKLLCDQHKNIWIVSFSKGSPETRLCLEELSAKHSLGNIKGWISISGLIKGSHLGDDKQQTLMARTLWRVTSFVLGVDNSITAELSRQNNQLQREMVLPHHIEIIHIVGFPLRSHLQPMLIKRHAKLSVHGPNDGIILLGDFLGMPGFVYPIWGVDHFLRSHQMSSLIYKLCHYINNK